MIWELREDIVALNGTTKVDLIEPPLSDEIIELESAIVFNADTVAQDLTLFVRDNDTDWPFAHREDCPVKGSLLWDERGGAKVRLSTPSKSIIGVMGAVKTTTNCHVLLAWRVGRINNR